ncbi:MAG: protein-disulfide reductase DsbD family protein [SAR86 cluster bacterium]|nr:protein-disulfide reductase DsbD family protein [SAR86 cluster bacterium]
MIRLRSLISKFYILILLGLAYVPSMQAYEYQDAGESSIEIITESKTLVAGDDLLIGLKFKLNPGWHTYWKNPGDAGEGASITWTLPDGVNASDILWPGPETIPVDPLMTFGYEDEVILLTQISSDQDIDFPINLSTKVSWFTCKDICIPQEAEVDIQIIEGQKTTTKNTLILEKVLNSLSKPFPYEYRLEELDNNYFLQFQFDKPGNIVESYFFPEDYGVINYSKIQNIEKNNLSVSLELPIADNQSDQKFLKGVLYIQEIDSVNYYAIKSPLTNQPDKGLDQSIGVLTAIFFAFIGGLILNVMPCVFPILSIKILSFIEQSDGSRKKLAQHGLIFSAGVLFTFLLIAGLLLAIKSTGESIGWGYQLQSPIVVSILIYLFTAIGIVFMNNLAIGGQLAQLGGLTKNSSDLGSSFFTGMLAVIVASPCTAPFMGSALGLALLQPGLSSISIFVGLGLGFSAPYLILSFNPSLLKSLPKPGEWMETMKQFMAFPMWASAIWLLWVLSGQVEILSVILVLLGALIISVGLWILEKTQLTTGYKKRFAQFFALILVVFSIWLIPTEYRNNEASSLNSNFYTPEKVSALRQENKSIFLNFTADWCITCKVNEAVALSRQNVKSTLTDREITYLKADWTKKDAVIANKLAEYGRTGVPLYLLFSKGKEPIILPEILTEDILMKYLMEVPK